MSQVTREGFYFFCSLLVKQYICHLRLCWWDAKSKRVLNDRFVIITTIFGVIVVVAAVVIVACLILFFL